MMNKRIFVITANKREAMTASCLMAEQQYQLIFCESVVDAVKNYQVNLVDLVLVDLPKSTQYLLDAINYLRDRIAAVIWCFTDNLPVDESIQLLESGADHCLPKSTDTKELLARIKAFFRREQLLQQVTNQSSVVAINEFSLCLTARELTYHNKMIDITAVEFELLQLLMSNSGRVISRQYIAEHVFNRNIVYCSTSINMHISNIRKKLKQFNDQTNIKTIRGSGYIFVSGQ